MQDHTQTPPALLDPAPVEAGRSWPALGTACIVAALICGVGGDPTGRPTSGAPAGYTRDDLGPNILTPIGLADPVAAARALAHLRLDDGERHRLSAELARGEVSLGLVAFYDDEVPDGDAIEVRGASFRQRVVLSAGLTPVVVPYLTGSPIEVEAVADGGDIATLAVMTASGPTHLKRLAVGEAVGIATR